MNNKTKTIIIVLPLFFFAMKGVAQSAYGDLLHALEYSQNAANAANAGNYAGAYSFASHTFDGGGSYHGSGSSHNHSSGYGYGSTVASPQPGRRTATNMSNVGLKIGSSGYNRGAELARYYAEQRVERARLKAEREERMVNSYMQMHYDNSIPREASWLMYIDNNSHAKPFSQEEIYEFISNGLPGNVIIDDNGMMNMAPEALLEGSGGTLKSQEEDLALLLAQALKRKAELEEEKKRLEEAIENKDDEKLNGIAGNANNQFDNNQETKGGTDVFESPESQVDSLAHILGGNFVLPDNVESKAVLPEGCTYEVLMQPSKSMETAQMVYGNDYGFPFLRMEGVVSLLPNNEIKKTVAFELPREIKDDENVIVLDDQLICKCAKSVKSVNGEKVNDVFSMSDDGFNIYPANSGSFYLVKHNADSCFVYLFNTYSKGFSKLFNVPSQISDFVGTSQEKLIVSDKVIYQVSEKMHALCEVANSKVQSLDFYSGVVFFSTEKACYCMGLSGKPIPFLTGNIKQVMVVDNRLYLLYKDGMLSVIDHAKNFQTLLNKVVNK